MLKKTKLLSYVLAAAAVASAGVASETQRPQIVTSRLVSIDHFDRSKRSILAVTPSRTCVKIRVYSGTRVIRNGAEVSFSQLYSETQLTCTGRWDPTTSPPSFWARQITIGRHVTKSELRSSGSSTSGPSSGTVIGWVPQPKVQLLGWSWHHKSTKSTVTGRVKNLTKSRLKNVVAVVSYFDANGRFVLSDTSVISKKDLGPGQVGEFKMTTNWEPDFCPVVKRVDVEFHFGKGNLPIKTPKPKPST